jgi:site-specific DNA recombinase
MRYFHYIRKSTDDDDHQILSLESQERENTRRFEGQPGIEIVEIIKESRSAKTPRRPLFDNMITRIERGEAEGIIAWHPDRLARNSIDGGRIIYLLDIGKLKDLKFATYTFENTPQGKFMLQIVFANSKYYVDSLSENIRRGNRAKVENGWKPNLAPVGYLNDQEASTIVADPERFELVKKFWQYALTGAYTVPQLLDLATNEWGLRTKKRKKIGGKPLTVSGAYRLLANPFYAGVLHLEGQTYHGKHPKMVTLTEFDAVQRVIGRIDAPRSQRHAWDYTGLMKCVCGRSITAEGTTNRFGSKYVYYHCTRRGKNSCAEPYLRVGTLEAEMRDFLAEVTLAPNLHAWALRKLKAEEKDISALLRTQRAALERARGENDTALKNLRYLRTHEQITETEFLADRAALTKEAESIAQGLERLSPELVVEPEQALVLFNVFALRWFDEGDGGTKRLLIEAAGSNPSLKDGKLKIDGRFPFRRYRKRDDIRELWSSVNEVRTHAEPATFGKLLQIMRLLKQKFGEDPFEAAA